MARLHLAVGTRYERGAHVYVVRQILLDDRLLVEDQSFGGQSIAVRDDLCAAWARGEITFEIRGAHTAPSVSTSLPTRHAIADLAHLPAPYRAEAWRRYRLIAPLLALTPRERTRAALDAHVAAHHTGDTQPGGRGSSRASVQRYLRAFAEGGGDLRALVPATSACGGAGQTRLDAEVERIVQGVLADCAAAPRYRTLRDVYLLVVARLRDANAHRPPDAQLPLPGRTTLYRRVRQAGVATILRRRPSASEAHADAAVLPGPRPDHALQRVEIDHTPLDLILVDEEDRLPIGRPTVTLALDVYSGFPLGVAVGFEPPCYEAAMRCLLHGILPKDDVQARYGTAHPWPVYGLPETLVVDHAPHLVGADLRDACGQLGIHLDPAPVRRPWFKGAIERQFRTHNTGLVHTLPGATFSNVLKRGDDDAAGQACLSLARFWEILHVYLLDLYAQEWRRGQGGVGGVPATRWAESVAAGWTPALPHDARELRLLLGRAATRTVQRAGIDYECLRYQSPALQDLRRRLPAGAAVTLKVDPDDLGAVHVYDATASGSWLCVPALDHGYANGLSLWKHRVIRRYVARTMRQAVDVYALAIAKERIQALVDEEFRRTRRVGTRQRLARAKGITLPAPPPVMEVSSPTPVTTRPQLMALPPVASVEPSAPLESLPDDTWGWGGDYNLPR